MKKNQLKNSKFYFLLGPFNEPADKYILFCEMARNYYAKVTSQNSTRGLDRKMYDLGKLLGEIGKNCPPTSRAQKLAIARALGSVKKLVHEFPSVITYPIKYYGYGLKVESDLGKHHEQMTFNELNAEFMVTFSERVADF